MLVREGDPTGTVAVTDTTPSSPEMVAAPSGWTPRSLEEQSPGRCPVGTTVNG